MNIIHTIRYSLAGFAAGIFLLVATGAEAAPSATSAMAAPAQEMVQGDDKPGKASNKKDKVNKPQKRKKVKQQRTNHGPRKSLFPQVERRGNDLDRRSYRDPYARN